MKAVNIETLAKDYTSGIRISEDLYIYQGKGEDELSEMRLDVLGICVPESGEYRIEVNSVKYILHAGEILICHPNDFYKGVTFSGEFYGTIIFASVDLISGLVEKPHLMHCLDFLKVSPRVKVDERQLRLLQNYCRLLESHREKMDRTSTFETTVLICRAFIADIFNDVLSGIEKHTRWESLSRPQSIYQNFINLLISTPEKPHDIDYYATQLFVRAKYLSAICKKESGKTASEWIKEYIMNDARRYLIGTDYSIKEVASRLGYSNFAFFCRTVKAYFGMTPLEIRNSV